MTKSSGGEVRGRRAVVTLTASGEVIKQNDSAVLLGTTIHHSGTWSTMIRDGKVSIRKIVAAGIITSRLQYLPLFGTAPDYLLRTLQV